MKTKTWTFIFCVVGGLTVGNIFGNIFSASDFTWIKFVGSILFLVLWGGLIAPYLAKLIASNHAKA